MYLENRKYLATVCNHSKQLMVQRKIRREIRKYLKINEKFKRLLKFVDFSKSTILRKVCPLEICIRRKV